MGFLEKNKFSSASRAWFMAALSWSGGAGAMTTNGARDAARLASAEVDWSIQTGGELRKAGYRAGDSMFWEAHDDDGVWLVSATGPRRAIVYKPIAKDFGAFRKALKEALKGGFNGGEKYGPWVERNRERAGIAIQVAAVAGAAIACLLPPGNVAAGAAVLAAGSGVAAGVASGKLSGDDLASAGAAVATAAGADPATVDGFAATYAAVTDAAAGIDPATESDPEPADPEPESPPLTVWERAKDHVTDTVDTVRQHPVESGVAVLGALLLRRLL